MLNGVGSVRRLVVEELCSCFFCHCEPKSFKTRGYKIILIRLVDIYTGAMFSPKVNIRSSTHYCQLMQLRNFLFRKLAPLQLFLLKLEAARETFSRVFSYFALRWWEHLTSTSMQWSAMMPMLSRLTGPSCSGETSSCKENCARRRAADIQQETSDSETRNTSSEDKENVAKVQEEMNMNQ